MFVSMIGKIVSVAIGMGHDPINLIFWLADLCIFLILSTAVLYLFVTRLNTLATIVAKTTRNVLTPREDENAISINKKQSSLLKIASKQTLLTGIALIPSFLNFIITILFLFSYRESIVGLSFEMVLLDIIANICCLTLQFPFAAKIYHRICFPCDRKCRMLCIKHLNNKVMEKNKNKMMLQSNGSSR